ncbi:hypothetical protein SLA2020_525680 [Shorea laevis]
MQLKFGYFPVVIASSPDMAKLFLKTFDNFFASRPQTATGKYTTYNYSNINWSRMLEFFEHIHVEEMRSFLSRLYALSGKPVVLGEQLSRATLSVISRMESGNKYFNESEHETGSNIVTLKEFQEMLDELFFLNGVLNIGDWIPWLDFLDLQGYVKRMKALKKKFDRFHHYIIEDHNSRRRDTNFVPQDMMDLLLQRADDDSAEIKLNYDGVKGFIQDLIGGGTDTSATIIEWAMSELLKQPELIKKATEELDKVIGRERWVQEKDIPQLPYIEAIMKETMRKHHVAVLLASHLALEDCVVGGFDIPKGTVIFKNTWSIGRNPDVWDTPEDFCPESLGLKMIASMIANLLHGFNWNLPENTKDEELSMEEVYGLTTPRKFPVVAILEPRLPLHLY